MECWVPAIAGLGLLLVGCGDTFIDPYDNAERYYTVYGFLDEGKNTQLLVPHELRVIAVSRFPERITSPLHPHADLDAKVFTRDLDAEIDTTIEWTHALEQLDDGLFAHIFSATFALVPSHTYRLEVIRSDGAMAWAETTVPDMSNVVPVPTNLRVEADSTIVLQDILLPGRVSPWRIDVSYDVGARDCAIDRGVTTPLAYGRKGDTSPEGWLFTVNITEDIGRLRERLDRPDIFFCAMGVRVRSLDPDWPIPDVEDPNLIALPAASTNVQNGYGFFGSVGVLQYEWAVSPALLKLIEDRGR
jgi:hypothetical protein